MAPWDRKQLERLLREQVRGFAGAGWTPFATAESHGVRWRWYRDGQEDGSDYVICGRILTGDKACDEVGDPDIVERFSPAHVERICSAPAELGATFGVRVNGSACVVPYRSTPSRWRVLLTLHENDGQQGTITTVYVRGDFPSEDAATQAGEQVGHAWEAGGALPAASELPSHPCEELIATVTAFHASGPDRLAAPSNGPQRETVISTVVRSGRRLADAFDRHRLSGCTDAAHTTVGEYAMTAWRQAEALVRRLRGE